MGKIKTLVRIDAKDPNTNRAFGQLENALQPLFNSEIIDGAVFEKISLTTGQDNLVEHKLDRQVRGYVVISNSANSVIYDKINSDTDTTNKKLFLNLQCSADTVVNLWIF